MSNDIRDPNHGTQQNSTIDSIEQLQDRIEEAKEFIQTNKPIVKEYYHKINFLKALDIDPYSTNKK